MNREPQWWKLYLFTAVILVTLFMIPPADSSALILFMGVVFVGLVLWVTTNQTGIASQERRPTRKVRPVDEFFDEDRWLIQHADADVMTDSAQVNERRII